METFILREDDVELVGTVVSVWVDNPVLTTAPVPSDGPAPGTWHVVLDLPAADPHLVAANGAVNALGWIECRVTPVAPYRDRPLADRLLAELVGQGVRVRGSWGDVAAADGSTRGTGVWSLAWIVLDRGLTSFVEEFGFTQTVRDIDVYAFSDDTDVGAGVAPPHHREDRHLEVTVPFPIRPQSSAVPKVTECVDRDDLEARTYFGRTASRPRFPLHHVRGRSWSVASDGTGDRLVLSINTGEPSQAEGFYYAKFVLTFDEDFASMCTPDLCLDDPNWSCQATKEERFSYVWPSFGAAHAGDLLLGPAGGGGVLGRLLGALHPAQFYDHMVIFTENDRRTVRHCTASDDRIQQQSYFNGSITVSTPLGDLVQALPLGGIREDVVQYAWPGSITQSLGEVSVTGRNRSNEAFAWATLYPEVVAAEAGAPPRLCELDPGERDKRTAYHDPEAAGRARRDHDAGARAWYSLVRLQRTPAWRDELDEVTGRLVGQLSPVIVQSHPLLAQAVTGALAEVAVAARDLRAHYRFFAYSNGSIGLDPTFDAPPAGSWGTAEGADWAAGSVAAVCSSFVLTAVHRANLVLAGRGQPVVLLEGETEPSDQRSAAGPDGLYLYQEGERQAAGKALYEFTYGRVVDQVRRKVEDLPGIVTAMDDLFGFGADSSPLEQVEHTLGTAVAGQLCNTFAADTPGDLTDRWQDPGEGRAVSPDDIMLRWDPNVAPEVFPPTQPGVVNVYGCATRIAIPRPGWRREPVYRVLPVLGTARVSGSVVLRRRPGAKPRTVAGALVRMGCASIPTGPRGGFVFDPTRTGAYHLQAFRFVVDPETGVGREWRSEPRLVELGPGDALDDQELELLAPPGLARDVLVESHHDVVDRVVVGKDRWGHFDRNGTIELAYDPADVAGAPPDQCNTVLAGDFDQTTDEVGSGVYVRSTVHAVLKEVPGPDGSHDYDGTVVCDLSVVFYDADEGETNATLTRPGVELAPGESFTLPYDLVSDDTVPERASGHLTVRNAFAVLS